MCSDNNNLNTNNTEAYIKRLQLQNMELQSQLDGLKNIYIDSNNQYKKALNCINSFCKTVLQKDFALSQIDGYDGDIQNMPYTELLNYVADKILKEKIEQNSVLLNLIEENNVKDQIIEDLKKQIYDLTQKNDIPEQEKAEILLNNNIYDNISENNITDDIVNTDDKNNNDTMQKDNLLFISAKQPTQDTPVANESENLKNNNKDNKKHNKTLLEENIVKEEDTQSLTIIVKDRDIKLNDEYKNTNPIEKNINKTDNTFRNNTNSIDQKTFDNSNKSNKNTDNNLKSKATKSNKYNKKNTTSSTEDYYVINLKNIANDLAEIHWDVIEAIGVFGFSEKADILNHIKTKYLDISEESLDQKLIKTLEELKISDIVSKERINTGIRMFFVYNITETGEKIYTNYAKSPKTFVESESEKLLRMHASLKHGYTIKDSAKILVQLGYKDVTYTEEENKITLDNGDIYIPDIIGTDHKTGEKMYFEVEFGFHSQSEFDAKCNKIAKISSTINFIVIDVKRRNNVSFQIKSWLLSLNGSNKHITTRITTIRNLRNNAWEIESL